MSESSSGGETSTTSSARTGSSRKTILRSSRRSRVDRPPASGLRRSGARCERRIEDVDVDRDVDRRSAPQLSAHGAGDLRRTALPDSPRCVNRHFGMLAGECPLFVEPGPDSDERDPRPVDVRCLDQAAGSARVRPVASLEPVHQVEMGIEVQEADRAAK